MSLAHEAVPESDNDGEGAKDLAMALSREELRTMANQVSEMYEGWDETQLGLATLTKNQKFLEEKQNRTDGRVEQLLELFEKHFGKHHRKTDSQELDDLERTENHTQVKMTIPRANKLLAAEKREQELTELLATVRWWKSTPKQFALGATKLFLKLAGTMASGYILRDLVLWLHR